MSIISEIKKNKLQTFRRLYIKKRLSTGEYDTDWTRINNEDVKTWGSVNFSVDEILPSFYKTSGMSFKVLNSRGQFAETDEEKSYFYQALTIYRSLVKVEAGYLAEDGSTEYPTNTTLYIGFISEDIDYTEDAMVNIKTKHISSILDEFPADRIVGLGAVLTSSEIVTLIKNHEDSNTIKIFQKYISATAWHITATAQTFNMATSTNLQNLSCGQLIRKLAVAENFVTYIDNNGDFYFKDKDGISTTADFHFSGVGDEDKSYGHNVMTGISVSVNMKKIYNRVKIKIAEGDTLASNFILNESWDWGDSSSSFMYGVRQYNYNNIWLNTAGADAIADIIFTDFSYPKQEVKLKSKFVPQLMVQDRVSLTYKTIRESSGEDRWGYFLWDYGRFGERPGYNINIDNEDYKLINLKHNIDNFQSQVTLREIT